MSGKVTSTAAYIMTQQWTYNLLSQSVQGWQYLKQNMPVVSQRMGTYSERLGKHSYLASFNKMTVSSLTSKSKF